MRIRAGQIAVALIAVSFTAAMAIAPTWGQGTEGVVLFNGTDLSGWKVKPHKKNASHWAVGTPRIDPQDPRRFMVDPADAGEGVIVNSEWHGVKLYSDYLHGDAIVELDVMVPKGSNSGVYLMGEYEVQVLDSFGREGEPDKGDMGAVYGVAAPREPEYRAPGEWQHLLIAFRAPRFDASARKVANAEFVRVELNGRRIHERLVMEGVTVGGLTGREANRGPLMLQGDHGPVAFRNILIRPLDE